MFEYKPNPEEMERRRKELARILQEENPKPRNRAERREYERKNKNTRRKF